MSIYAGDELYDDNVTSGPIDDRWDAVDIQDRWDDPDTNDGIEWAQGDE